MIIHTFPEGAGDYYDVEMAKKCLENPYYLESLIKLEFKGKITLEWWRCVLCGFPRHNIVGEDMIAATGCGGCGQTCMRPIAEYGDVNAQTAK